VIRRLEQSGHRCMLLLHDSHPWTAEMVPMLLSELKAKGYRIVHMVPGPGNGPTTPARAGWTSETERVIGALKSRLEKHTRLHAPSSPTKASQPKGGAVF